MKKFVAAFVLSLTGVAAFAQGYAGVVAALSSVDAGCSDQLSCDKKGHALKVYFGTALAKGNQIDFGIGKLQSVEVGLIAFGKGASTSTTVLYDGNTDPADPASHIVVPTSRSITANALTLAGAAKFPIVDDLAVVAKGGLAYVSSTIRYYTQGGQNGSETATKLKPYLGLGVEFEAMKGFRIVGSYDWTKFDVADQKGSLKALGLGAEIGF